MLLGRDIDVIRLAEISIIGYKHLMSKGAIWPSSPHFSHPPVEDCLSYKTVWDSPEGKRNNENITTLLASEEL